MFKYLLRPWLRQCCNTTWSLHAWLTVKLYASSHTRVASLRQTHSWGRFFSFPSRYLQPQFGGFSLYSLIPYNRRLSCFFTCLPPALKTTPPRIEAEWFPNLSSISHISHIGKSQLFALPTLKSKGKRKEQKESNLRDPHACLISYKVWLKIFFCFLSLHETQNTTHYGCEFVRQKPFNLRSENKINIKLNPHTIIFCPLNPIANRSVNHPATSQTQTKPFEPKSSVLCSTIKGWPDQHDDNLHCI